MATDPENFNPKPREFVAAIVCSCLQVALSLNSHWAVTRIVSWSNMASNLASRRPSYQ